MNDMTAFDATRVRNIDMFRTNLETWLADIDHDTGAADAWHYIGYENMDTRPPFDTAVHAMVRQKPGGDAFLMDIDLYVPHVVYRRKPDTAAELVQRGFYHIGHIDNHFTDVLGHVAPVRAQHPLPPGARAVTVHGLYHLTSAEAKNRAAQWRENAPDLAVARAARRHAYERFLSALNGQRIQVLAGLFGAYPN